MNTNIANLSISEISNLYKNKELKPSEVYEEVFTNASLSESIIHAHLKLFQDEAIEASKLSVRLANCPCTVACSEGVAVAACI